jgi:hypothetical protein
VAAVFAVLVTGAAAATTVLPQEKGAVDLLDEANVRIDGFGQDVRAGLGAAGAGDVNGDGRSDVIIGAPFAGRADGAGVASVVFGRPGPATISLGALGTGGFDIRGALLGHTAGQAVAGVGDVNGDGRADVLVGAPFAGFNGAAWVVFGKSSTTQVDLGALGSQGFRVNGASGDEIGHAVADAGDVNGDGLADIVLGSPLADRNGRQDSGSVYVVFGRSSTTTVELAALGAGGFRIDGAAAGDLAGGSVAGGMDVNDDGRPDVVLGAPQADSSRRTNAGSAYVVFGKSSTTTVDLSSLNDRGLRIAGAAAGDFVGSSVANAGDVNGDERQDVVVGASGADFPSRLDSGSAYVVFGSRSTSTIDLAALGDRGFRIIGATPGGRAGLAVAGVGDVNGDGRPDVGVGAPLSDNNGRPNSGAAHVVFGRVGTAPIDLARPFKGFRIDGAKSDDDAGRRVAAAGDFNGDRRFDVLVAAPKADGLSMPESGKAYIVYGFRQAARRDTRAPTITFTASSARPVASRRDVRLAARCDETCALRATGTVEVAGAQTIRLQAAQAPVAPAGSETILTLRLTASETQVVAAALDAGKRVRVNLKVVATDVAGNTATKQEVLSVR